MSFACRKTIFPTRYISGPILHRPISTAHAGIGLSFSSHDHDLAFPRPSIPKPAKMKTHILTVNPSSPSLANILSHSTPAALDVQVNGHADESYANVVQAARALRTSDTPVAFPTETVYGLAADATRDAPVENVFKVKGRPSDNPLIVHFASVEMLRDFLRSDARYMQNGADDPIPVIYRPLLEKQGFMPGPLTILLKIPSHARLSTFVTGSAASLSTFAARIPSSTIARALIQLAGVPIAAPSANVSGRPSPTTAEHVFADLDGRIDFILDGGACDVGVESTVVDGLDESGPVVLRPGGVGVEELRSVEGWENARVVGRKKGEAVRAPGMKYRHYAPKAQVILVPRGETVNVKGMKHIGVVSTGGLDKLVTMEQGTDICVIDLGQDARDVARGLFGALRDLDEKGVEAIYVEEVDESRGDVAVAVMNRLRKAAE